MTEGSVSFPIQYKGAHRLISLRCLGPVRCRSHWSPALDLLPTFQCITPYKMLSAIKKTAVMNLCYQPC